MARLSIEYDLRTGPTTPRWLTTHILFCVPQPPLLSLLSQPRFFISLTDRPERSTFMVRGNCATWLPGPERFPESRLRIGNPSLVCDWRTYLPRKLVVASVTLITPSRVYIRFDETRLNSATAQFSPAIRDIVGAVTRVVKLDKKKRNSRINEIAIIDTPILALKDTLAPCTPVRDIIDPAHAIARIPLRFN